MLALGLAGMKPNRVVGVTGITGSGTSTVSGILAEHGGFVISADKLAHEVMQAEARQEIVHHFSVNVLDETGKIDRKKLGGMVFGKPEKLNLLETIIHPHVIAKTLELLDNCQHSFAVIDAPLLVEAGMHKICSEVWLVTATDDVRLRRIVLRDGISQEAALRRLHSRAGDSHLSQVANVVIENNAGPGELQSIVKTALGLPNSLERI